MILFSLLIYILLSFSTIFPSITPVPFIFHSTQETMAKIVDILSTKQKSAYLRFGDGDACLAWGGSELLQLVSPELTKEMQETFALDGPTILKSLPIHSKALGSYEDGMCDGNQEASIDWCLRIINRVAP